MSTVLAGDLVDVTVVARTASGRAATVRVTGTLGTRDVPGTTVRSLLGLRLTWFRVAHQEPLPLGKRAGRVRRTAAG